MFKALLIITTTLCIAAAAAYLKPANAGIILLYNQTAIRIELYTALLLGAAIFIGLFFVIRSIQRLRQLPNHWHSNHQHKQLAKGRRQLLDAIELSLKQQWTAASKSFASAAQYSIDRSEEHLIWLCHLSCQLHLDQPSTTPTWPDLVDNEHTEWLTQLKAQYQKQSGYPTLARDTLKEYLAHNKPTAAIILQLLDELINTQQWDEIEQLLQQHHNTLKPHLSNCHEKIFTAQQSDPHCPSSNVLTSYARVSSATQAQEQAIIPYIHALINTDQRRRADSVLQQHLSQHHQSTAWPLLTQTCEYPNKTIQWLQSLPRECSGAQIALIDFYLLLEEWQKAAQHLQQQESLTADQQLTLIHCWQRSGDNEQITQWLDEK